MTEKDKLSKEVEEQIQSLASDVYIQIEEKLTQLIGIITPKEQVEKINIQQDPGYLALQNELSEKIHQLEKNADTLKAQDEDSAEKIAQLVQENISIKQQLDDEIDKQEGSELNFQVELTQNNINFTETVERLEHENTQLKSTLTQEQTLSAQKEHLHQEQTQVDEQNQQLQSQIVSNEKESLEQQQTIATLKESIALLVAQEQRLKAVLSEKTENLNQTIEVLKQEFSVQKEQLNQEQTQANEHNQQLQSQIVSNETKLLEQQKEIAALNEDIATHAAQEQNLTERLSTVEQQRNNSDNKFQKAEASWKKTDEVQTNSLTNQKIQIEELTKELMSSVNDLERAQKQHQQQTISSKQESEQAESLLREKLQQSQKAEENQQKIVADQQDKLVQLDNKIKYQMKEIQDSQQEIKQLNNVQSQIKQQKLADTKANDIKHQQQQQAQATLQKQIDQLEIQNQELSNSLVTEKADIKLYQKEVSTLKSQVALEKEGYENILNRFNVNRERQETDNDQVRETIKYLRDENNNMITQNNIQKEGFIEQISELEHKLTEYRLKFEYAQKQLTQNS